MESWGGPSISCRRAHKDGTGKSGADQTACRCAPAVGFCGAHVGGGDPDKAARAGGVQSGKKGSLSVTGSA
jgi:hypothetical protein